MSAYAPARNWRLPALLAASMLAVSCSGPSAPTTYERIVIETYPAELGSNTDTYIDLFGSGGDPDADDPWVAANDAGDALASDDNGANIPNPPDHTTFSRIDPVGGLSLTSGIYYIRVRHRYQNGDGAYVLRVLSLQLDDEDLPAYDYPGVIADPFEPDDDPANYGALDGPAPEIELGAANRLNRFLDYDAGPPVDGDVDWFKLVLP